LSQLGIYILKKVSVKKRGEIICKISYLAAELIGAVVAVIDSIAAMPHWNAVSTLAVETFHAGVETGLHLHGVIGRALVVSTHCPLTCPYTD
jgi:hypothetical protein